jgi:hypothetical protein
VIEHVVLIKPLTGVAEADVAALRAGLARMRGLIPGIVDFVYGDNISSEGKDLGFTQGFIITFQDRNALDGYLPHPEHLAVVPLVRAVAADVLVFDVERE